MGRKRFGFVFTDRNLKVDHPRSDPIGLIYTMLDKPEHGYLINLLNGRLIKKVFTQAEIDTGKVAYVLSENAEGFNDSFTFKVEDTHGNVLDNQRFVKLLLLKFSA